MSFSFYPVGTLSRAVLSEWAYNEVKEMHAKCYLFSVYNNTKGEDSKSSKVLKYPPVKS